MPLLVAGGLGLEAALRSGSRRLGWLVLPGVLLGVGAVIAAPALTLDASRSGSARSSAPGGVQVAFEARPGSGDQLSVEVTIEKAGAVVQKSALRVTPTDAAASGRISFSQNVPVSSRVMRLSARKACGL